MTDVAGRLPQLRQTVASGSAAEAAVVARSIAGTAAIHGLCWLSVLAREVSGLAAKGAADPASLGPIAAEYSVGGRALRALLEG